MSFKLAEFDNLITKTSNLETMKNNFAKILSDIEKNVVLLPMAIFLKNKSQSDFSVIAARNVTSAEKEFFSFEPSEGCLENLSSKGNYIAEKELFAGLWGESSQSLILPVNYRDTLFGFLVLRINDGDFDADLISHLEMYVSIIGMQIQIFIQQIELKKVKKIDNITNVYTFNSFLEQGNFLLKQVNRYHRYLTMIVIGIDNGYVLKEKMGMKSYNILRRKMSEKLKKYLRESDLVGVIDEYSFAILMPETPVSIIIKVLERLNKLILEIENLKSTEISWGVAGKNEEIKKINELLAEAMDAKEESEYKSEDKITFYE